MEKYRDIKINNSLDAAVKDGKWKDPGASLYSKLINASHYDGKMPEDSKELDDMIKKKKVTGLEDYLQEAYLVVENKKIINNPYGITSFNRSGCKYPHHVLRGNDKDGWELVVSIPGLKAAYTRAKQQGIFSGKVKEHLERHYKELGLYEDSTMNTDKKIHENFEFIESTINNSLGVDLFEENTGLEIDENGIGSIDESFAWMENFLNAKKYDSFVAANLNSVLLNRTPEELLRWMNCISYGWYSYEDQSFHGTDDDDPTDYFYKYYRLQTPEELVRRQIGVCWDCTELEREWFEKHNYQFGVFYLEIDNRQECPSHTFLVYRENNRYYWFEHSWYDYRGIHGYVRLQDLLYDVITKHQKANRDDRSPVIITLMKDKPKTNATCQEFIDHAHSQQRFYINSLPTTLMDESINLLNEFIEENHGFTMDTLPDKMYFSSRNKHEILVGRNGRLFLSPYIGISSMFLIDTQKILIDLMTKHLGKNPIHYSGNISYKEWEYDENIDLTKPLDFVHITHNFPDLKEIMSGESSGYIHEVDISNIKDQLTLFITNNPNREVIYTGDEPLIPSKIIHHNLHWTIEFDQKNADMHGIGKFESVLKENSEEEETKKESLPKQTDKAESNKNGVRRKQLYVTFIEWCKEYNSKNTFGSIFDKDAFNVSYPFVPHEMRYFYRLANPMLCVLSGDLTFFPVAELRKLNSKNSKLQEMMIFAATPNDFRVFNNKDKKVYRGTDENGAIKLQEELGPTFDLYIQNMIKKGDILNAPLEDKPDNTQTE